MWIPHESQRCMHRRKYARHIQTEGECCKHANPGIVKREGVFVLCLKKARDSCTEGLKVFLMRKTKLLP